MQQKNLYKPQLERCAMKILLFTRKKNTSTHTHTIVAGLKCLSPDAMQNNYKNNIYRESETKKHSCTSKYYNGLCVVPKKKLDGVTVLMSFKSWIFLFVCAYVVVVVVVFFLNRLQVSAKFNLLGYISLMKPYIYIPHFIMFATMLKACFRTKYIYIYFGKSIYF